MNKVSSREVPKDPQKQEFATKCDDSDCEIMEPQVSVIDLVDSAGDLDATVVDEVFSLDEEEPSIVEIGEVTVNEEDSHRSPPVAECETLCTVTFGDDNKYECLREFVKGALQKCLEERSILVDTIEDEQSRTVNFIERAEMENNDDPIFAIDTMPANKPETNAVPSYRRSIREVFNDEEKKKPNEDECRSTKRMSLCFNCAGTHSLRDCQEPRNQQRINKAKKQYMTKTERYHIDIEQRFAHIKPGKIGDGLRKALGLRSYEIPPFIYKMRQLGYPPGWLEEAKVSNSGLVLFDSEGREVQGSDDEEGELNENKHKYDVRKIISFPGFNCDPGYGMVEDQRMPPMLLEDQKDKFIESLGGNIIKGYKRKKLKNLNALELEKSQDPNESVDMDVDNEDAVTSHLPDVVATQPHPLLYHGLYTVPGLPISFHQPPPPLPTKDEQQPPPPPPPEHHTPEGEIESNQKAANSARRRSPTLEDLKAKQRALLMALEDSNTKLDVSADDSLIDDILEIDRAEDGLASPLTTNSDSQISNRLTQFSESTAGSSTPTQNFEIPNSKMLVLGTPVFQFSPYDKLPTGDQFSVGVSDVINFENLPDSTGKYEQMVKVIEKVRKAVQKSNEEN